jgi:hypothetical protein
MLILNLLMKKAVIKFRFSKKATKIVEIFTVDLTVCSKCQIDCEDFIKFCGLLRKHELYCAVISFAHLNNAFILMNLNLYKK